jgi:hypothetical protein
MKIRSVKSIVSRAKNVVKTQLIINGLINCDRLVPLTSCGGFGLPAGAYFVCKQRPPTTKVLRRNAERQMRMGIGCVGHDQLNEI